jgi:hypothetical protein
MIIDKQKAMKIFDKAAELALTTAGISMVSKAKNNLTSAKKRDTGLLINSVAHKVKIGNQYSIAKTTYKSSATIEDNEQSDNSVIVGTNLNYAQYIELGTSPHTTNTNSAEFLENINKWLDRHGIVDKSIRYLIIRKIRRNGTVASPYLRPVFDNISPKMESIFATAFKKVTANWGTI